jgi:hypothetical protein
MNMMLVFAVSIVICDPGAIDPNTGNTIRSFISNSNFATDHIPSTSARDFDFSFPANFQPRKLIFPVIMIIGKETKDNLEIMLEVFLILSCPGIC